MGNLRRSWALAGIVAGALGVLAANITAALLSVQRTPVVSFAQWVVELAPGSAIEAVISQLGKGDKPFLLGLIGLGLVLCFALAGVLARAALWRSLVVYGALAALAYLATHASAQTSPIDDIPIAVALFVWPATLMLLTGPLMNAEAAADQVEPQPEPPPADVGAVTDPTSTSRRGFAQLLGVGAAVAVLAAVGSQFLSSSRQRIEQTMRLLKLEGVTMPESPVGVEVGVTGVAPWQTPNEEFYLIDTAFSKPTIEPDKWELRVHGLVENELRISYDELIKRKFTEDWVTLMCVSNRIGEGLVGNAWWSGVRVADLLAEAKPLPEADAVFQTSHDGWTCATPISALTDDRNSLLAVAMNGEPLPVEHGFPVRVVVPGLYGFVSATKWVVDFEVTKFEDVTAFWTSKGWSEQAPIKICSRIDVPQAGAEVSAGSYSVGGVAWDQHIGIERVEVSLDGGAWTETILGGAPNDDTWVQWRADLEVATGDHSLRVRAVSKDGEVQTGVEQDVEPDGATGWHTVEFVAT